MERKSNKFFSSWKKFVRNPLKQILDNVKSSETESPLCEFFSCHQKAVDTPAEVVEQNKILHLSLLWVIMFSKPATH